MMSRRSVGDRLDQLRTLEMELSRQHSDEQQYRLESFGARDYDPEEPTTYSRAADALEQLLDALDEILSETEEAETSAVVNGDLSGESATLSVKYILDTLNEHLGDDA